MRQRPSYEIETISEDGNKSISPAGDYNKMKDIVFGHLFFVKSMKIMKCVDGEWELFKEITIK